MRYKEIEEHYSFAEQTILPLPLKSRGKVVGSIGTNTIFGPRDVYSYDENVIRNYGVLDNNDQDISHIRLQHGFGKYWFVREAYTDIKYQKKGLANELMLFALTAKGLHLLSDVAMSPSGMKLWNGFMKASKREIKIVDVKTQEIFTMNDIDNKPTKDGVTVIRPEHDVPASGKIEDLRFFYLIEGYAVEKPKPGEYSRFGCPFYPDRRNLESMLTPYSHFSN